jgi:uncharacterized protein YecT (DUF1311 family)
MKVLIAFILITLQSIAFASDDCGEPEGSSLVEGCHLNKQIGEMDKQLNIQYQKIIKMYKKVNSTVDVNNLIAAQRAWIVYRDKVCDFEDHAYGGINSISWVRCKARITETRLKELNELDAGE